jgi:hypothetical protein
MSFESLGRYMVMIGVGLLLVVGGSLLLVR